MDKKINLGDSGAETASEIVAVSHLLADYTHERSATMGAIVLTLKGLGDFPLSKVHGDGSSVWQRGEDMVTYYPETGYLQVQWEIVCTVKVTIKEWSHAVPWPSTAAPNYQQPRPSTAITNGELQ